MAIAFRLIRDGAAFLAMHRNPWWYTPDGVTLDAGAFVVGLEYSTGRRALVLGKPSPVVFRQALDGVRPTSVAGSRPARSRWSATTRMPMSAAPSGSGCAASSC